MKLMMDGKEVGQMDQSGEIRDESGAPIKGPQPKAEDKPELMDVPLHPTPPRRMRRQEEEVEEEENTEEEDEEQVDDKLLEHPLIAQLVKGQTRLQQQLGQLAKAQNRHRPQEEQIDYLKEEFLNDEKDPTGIARTLKGLVKRVNQLSDLGEKVGRVDQHLGYKEAQSLLEESKSHHPVFKDKQLGKLAERLLKAELQSNQEDDMDTIVRSVAREVIRAHPERAVREKAKQKEKLPSGGGLRRSEGVTPSVTVHKPRNLDEAREAYQSWKNARAKAMNRG